MFINNTTNQVQYLLDQNTITLLRDTTNHIYEIDAHWEMVYVVEIVKDVFPLQIKATSLHTTVFHSPRTTSISQQKQAVNIVTATLKVHFRDENC
jgi:hypothetical protein